MSENSNKVIKQIRDDLFSMQDAGYRDFQSRLLPTVDKAAVIGVRVPKLRKYAKGMSSEAAAEFMSALPHKYYEENSLHAFLIERIGEYERTVAELERFLPYVDNWANCDGMRPKVFKKHTEPLYEKVKEWIKSPHVYTVRYAVGILHSFFLDDSFLPEHLRLVADVKSGGEYYIDMMCAWYFATALSKQREHAVVYLTGGLLSDDVRTKTIKKACESFRISDEDKRYFRSLLKK